MTNLRATMCSFYPPLSEFSVLWVLKPLQVHRKGKESEIKFIITPRLKMISGVVSGHDDQSNSF